MRRPVFFFAIFSVLTIGVALAFLVPLQPEPPSLIRHSRALVPLASSSRFRNDAANWYDWLDNTHIVYINPKVGLCAVDINTNRETPLPPMPPFVTPQKGRTGYITELELSHDKRHLLRGGVWREKGRPNIYVAQAVRLKPDPREPRIVEWRSQTPYEDLMWLLDGDLWMDWRYRSNSDVLYLRSVRNPKRFRKYNLPLPAGASTAALTEIPAADVIRGIRPSGGFAAAPTVLERITPSFTGAWKIQPIVPPTKRDSAPIYASSGGQLVWQDDAVQLPEPAFLMWVHDRLEDWHIRKRPESRNYLSVSNGDATRYRRVALLPGSGDSVGIPRLSPDGKTLAFAPQGNMISIFPIEK